MTVSDLAAITGLSWDTIKGIVKRALEKGYGHPRLKDLRYLSIDEIYLGREKKFYTLVIDLESGRIVWVAKGKGADSLRKFWRALRLSKARIAAVTMDMSAAYWAAVAENLPEAAVVFDRFHIVKLVNEKLADLRRAMVREATGLMKQTVKGIRYLLLMNRHNVGPDRLPRLEEALQTNEPLNVGYLLKEALGLLWEQRRREDMAGFLQ
jgi:transposase